jgi:hypothetical protein
MVASRAAEIEVTPDFAKGMGVAGVTGKPIGLLPRNLSRST